MQTKDQQLQIRVTTAQKADIQRAAVRAGLDVTQWILTRLLPPAGRRFRDLTRALAVDPAARRFTLAELNDFLSGLSAQQFQDATAEPPPAALPRYWANCVAAMVETAANQKGVASPPAFRRRRIFVDATVGDRV
jgi:uncharacterized protein (DUF1778 family)